MTIHRSRILSILGLLALGVLLGAGGVRYVWGSPAAIVSAKKQMYRCPMHPQIVQDHEGKCPICGMNLVPVDSTQKSVPPFLDGCCGQTGPSPEPSK
jgi:membrane fusion protein, copper/silver efflux system